MRPQSPRRARPLWRTSRDAARSPGRRAPLPERRAALPSSDRVRSGFLRAARVVRPAPLNAAPLQNPPGQ
eukprot:5287139-Prymnesium_polylepis.1